MVFMNHFRKQSQGKPTILDDGFEASPVDTAIREQFTETHGADRTAVLEYMLELNDQEYDDLIKIAAIYRKANKQVDDILANAPEPEITDEPIEQSPTDMDDDELDGFLADSIEAVNDHKRSTK